jgi:hypothetical protein
MFHVEHCPIEPAPAAMTALFDELVNSRVNDLDWNRPRQISQRFDRQSVDTGFYARIAVEREAYSSFDRPCRAAEYGQALRRTADQLLRMPGAKRAPATEKKDSFQERRLTCAVAAPNEVKARVKRKFRRFDAAHLLDVKVRKAHDPGAKIPSAFLGAAR